MVWCNICGSHSRADGDGISLEFDAMYIRNPQIFQKFWRHLQILGTIQLLWSKCHIEDPQFWSDLWTSPLIWHILLGTCGLIHIFICKEKTAIIVLRVCTTWYRCDIGTNVWKFIRPTPTTLCTVFATTPNGLLLLLPSLPFPTSYQWSLLFRLPWRWRHQVENIDDYIQ